MGRFDLIIFVPEVFVAFWLIALTIQFTIVTRRKIIVVTKNFFHVYVVNTIPCATSLILLLAVVYFFLQSSHYEVYNSIAGFYCTPPIQYIRLVISLIFVLYIIHLRNDRKNLTFYTYEFYIILFFAFMALNLLLVSSNFLNLFLFIEVYGVCVYYLIASRKDVGRSIEAAIKYFIIGSISSAFLIFGMFLVYYSTGCSDILDISNLTNQNIYYQKNLYYIFGTYMICLSFLIKIGASVFYYWMVEVYDGISFNMLIFLNTFPKLVYLITLFNIVNKFNLSHLSIVIKLFVLSSLLIGLIGALNEFKTKRFLVFTSIYNITFLSMPFWTPNPVFIGVFLLFSSLYLLNFFVFMILFANLKDLRTNIISKNLVDLIEIRAQNPRMALLFILFTILASGLPLTAVFLAKFAVLFEISRFTHMFILFYFLFLGGLSFFYYFRLMRVIILGTNLPNMLIPSIPFNLAMLYSIVLWMNLIVIFIYDELIVIINFYFNVI